MPSLKNASRRPESAAVRRSVPRSGAGSTPEAGAFLARFQAAAARQRGIKGLPGYDHLLPPHPEPWELFVVLPPPPKVPPHAERVEQLEFVGRWYRAAVESRGLKVPLVAPLRSHRAYFEDALEVFVKENLRPGAYVAWALDRVLSALPTNAKKRFQPPVKVLLSPKTLTTDLWMFREAEGDYAVSRYVETDAGQEFMRVWKRVREEIIRGPRTKEAAQRAVASAWPEGYWRARESVREKVASEGQGLRERLRLGEWVWRRPK